MRVQIRKSIRTEPQNFLVVCLGAPKTLTYSLFCKIIYIFSYMERSTNDCYVKYYENGEYKHPVIITT